MSYFYYILKLLQYFSFLEYLLFNLNKNKKKLARQFVVLTLLVLTIATAFAADAPSASPKKSLSPTTAPTKAPAAPTKAPASPTKAPAAAPKSSSASSPKASSLAVEGPVSDDDYNASSPSDSEASTVSSPPSPTPDSSAADGPSNGPSAESPSNGAVTNVKFSVVGIMAVVGFFFFSF
ncbi:PREDICTED: classical arabinogalactan protein 6 [Camelina sativa]|uniref:Classical arabinogalactan protein 6 n=1 Tax=Camelina sativa TaxID=90675 RepID=A0ABM0VI54_CAMSA|nr:PREDICTED: classical arabinogalactan protein 6 [Camelina sativa]